MTARLTTKPMPQSCPQLVPRPGWHGRCHAGHARCVQAARRAEAKQRQFLYDARKRAAS
jgi:hypothetical protein